MTPILEITDLRLRLPNDTRTLLLDGVTLTVDQGETVSLVGESGSGKSVTVRAVLGLVPEGAVVTGSILFRGQAVGEMSRDELRRYRQRGAAMIFQDPRAAINPVRPIGDYLTEGLRISRGLSKQEAITAATSLLESVGISRPAERLSQYPHEFSGGMLQRVMIAGAIGSGAELLLADEPTTALDVSIQAEIMGLLAEIQQRLGLAVVFVTHDIDLAVATSSRIDVMYAGRVVESRNARELHDAPWHPYSAALITSRPMVSHRTSSLKSISGRPATAQESEHKCAFAPRCGYSVPSCSESQPRVFSTNKDYARCSRTLEIRDDLAETVHIEIEELDAPRSTDLVVEVSDLRKSFKVGRHREELVAVDGVSFTVQQGECLGIVGESGSGKSTLAKLLLGIETPDSGTILVSGEARGIRPRSSAQRRHWGAQLQVVFQDPYTSLDPRQTPVAAVEEIIALHFPGQTKAWRSEEADRHLASVGIEGSLRTALPAELSGGQRQRVAIAKALAASPQAVILDEAVSGLDISIQAQVLNLLSDLQRETQVSYLFISHDLAVIRQIAHRVIVMRGGQIVERGSTAQVLDNPQHEYTRRLISAAPHPDWHPPSVTQEGFSVS